MPAQPPSSPAELAGRGDEPYREAIATDDPVVHALDQGDGATLASLGYSIAGCEAAIRLHQYVLTLPSGASEDGVDGQFTDRQIQAHIALAQALIASGLLAEQPELVSVRDLMSFYAEHQSSMSPPATSPGTCLERQEELAGMTGAEIDEVLSPFIAHLTNSPRVTAWMTNAHYWSAGNAMEIP